MRNLLFLLSILFTLSHATQAQTNDDLLKNGTIKILRFQGGYKYTQNNKVIKLRDLATIVSADEQAVDSGQIVTQKI